MKLTSLVFTLGLTAITAAALVSSPAFARHGADDPAGDDRGGKGGGKDDGPNHTMIIKTSPTLQMARHGADDPAGDDRGGKGRGKDDAPNHG